MSEDKGGIIMKKLLLGALLVVGATSFGATTQLSESTDNKWSGSTSLTLTATGNIVSTVKQPTLVVEPVLGGASANSLDFNFGDIVMGQDTEERASFTAKILVDGKAHKIGAGVMTAELRGGTAVSNDEDRRTITLMDSDGTNTTELGTLTYAMTFESVGAAAAATEYRGDIIANVKADTAGSFTNTDGSVHVTVTDFAYDNGAQG